MVANVFGGSGKKHRGTWCTPKWLAKLIGKPDLDPCSNLRSHVKAGIRLTLEENDDGLHGKPGQFRVHEDVTDTDEDWTVFINPPYERGGVTKWIEHYKHTRFIFLLKWSPDTKWFARLIPLCTHVWFPNRRVNFEPPPGVPSSNNPLPHALYLRNPPADLVLRLETSGYLIPLDGASLTPQSTSYEDSGTDGGGGKSGPRKRRTGGSRKGVRGAGGNDGLHFIPESDDEGCSCCAAEHYHDGELCRGPCRFTAVLCEC